jgi:hypothetical protein
MALAGGWRQENVINKRAWQLGCGRAAGQQAAEEDIKKKFWTSRLSQEYC